MLFTLPWRWTGQPRPRRAVVFASRFDGADLRSGWMLFWGGIRLRREVLRSPGALGVSLQAHPLKGVYYTLSMWKDENSLLAFARSEEHRAVTRDIKEAAPVQGVLISRHGEADRPRWRETRRWVDAAEPGPYRLDIRTRSA